MSFPRYPAYKDSGVEWLGAIPAHWSATRLKHSAKIVNDRLDTKPENSTYLGLENIQSQTGRLLVEATAEQVESVVGVFQAGDVLFGKLRPYLAKVVRPDFPGVCTTELLVLRPGNDGDSRFLFYQLLSEPVVNLIDSYTYGSKMPRVNAEQIGNTVLPLPPLAEQRAIAAFLDAETARADALVARQEALAATLREKRRALISHAVTRGLDPAAPMRDSGVPWLGEVPAHWEVKRLKYLSPYITVGIVVTPSKYYVDSGVPCLRSLNVREGRLLDTDLVYISEESNQELRKSMIFEGDLVSVRSGQPGTTAVVDRRFHTANCIDLILIRQSPLFNSYYLCYQLNSDYAKLQFGLGSDGAIQQHFNIETASNLVVLHPPIEEQRLILAFLDHETAQIDTLIAKAQACIGLLREHRTALIAAAVTGQIDVRGWAGGGEGAAPPTASTDAAREG